VGSRVLAEVVALEGPIRPQEPAAKEDPESWVDILLLFVAVWRWDVG